MKNIVLWSRAADLKILAVIGFAGCLTFAAAVGSALSPPTEGDHIRFVDAFITTMLLVFVWAGFRLVRPVWYNQTWVVAEFIAVPVLWTSLVVALGLWFGKMNDWLEPATELAHNVTLL
jgi:hypothetical protein